MDWAAWGAIGEIVGAFAVVLSLVYVGRQIRQNTRVARSEAFRNANSEMARMLDSWGRDDAWIELQGRIRGGLTRGEMTEIERGRAGLHTQAFLEYALGVHWQIREGILPSSAYRLFGELVLNTPYMREMWTRWRSHYPDHFAEAMEREYHLRRGENTTAPAS